MSMKPFTTGVDHGIVRLMEVSVMFDICTHCVFTLYGNIIVERFRENDRETKCLHIETIDVPDLYV